MQRPLTKRQEARWARSAWKDLQDDLRKRGVLSEAEAEALARHRAIGLDAGGYLRLDVTPKDAKAIDEKGLYGPIHEAARSFLGVEGLALSNKPQAKVAAPIVTDEPRSYEGRAFVHSFFTHVGLPRGRPKNPDGTPATEFERRSKRAVLHVAAGWMEHKEYVALRISALA
jgi:hypothetical protein